MLKVLATLCLFAVVGGAWGQPLLWLKADAGVDALGDGTVISWTDQSGNGFEFSGNGSDGRPQRVTTVLNGLPAIRFDGSEQLDGSLGNITLSDATIFAVYRHADVTSSNNYLYTFGDASGAGSQMTLARRAGVRAYHYDGSTANFPSDTCVIGGQWQLTTQVFGDGAGTSHDLYQYGELMLPSQASSDYSVNADNVSIGNWSSSSFHFNGDLVELILYDRVLDAGERAEVLRYLKNRAGVGPYDTIESLAGWSVHQYPFATQGAADWEVCTGQYGVIENLNADASILVSDFDVADRTVTGTFGATGGPDFYGFVFGYQGPGRYYLFDWKETTATYFGEEAEAGMRLRVVNYPPGQSPTGAELWSSSDLGSITTLRSNTLAWQPDRPYRYRLIFAPGSFRITIFDRDAVIEDWSVDDSTFQSGQFGFFNSSQSDANYSAAFVEDDDLIFADDLESDPAPVD